MELDVLTGVTETPIMIESLSQIIIVNDPGYLKAIVNYCFLSLMLTIIVITKSLQTANYRCHFKDKIKFK